MAYINKKIPKIHYINTTEKENKLSGKNRRLQNHNKSGEKCNVDNTTKIKCWKFQKQENNFILKIFHNIK